MAGSPVFSPKTSRTGAGSAVKYAYDNVTGYYSVHTNAGALRKGESNIAAIGSRLHNQDVLGRMPIAPVRAR